MADSDGKFYLLLGAGFSRNWGGWLASEVEEYLLSLPALGPVVRSQLLECRARGGFEKALANLASNDNTRHEFESLQDALAKMFQSMDQSFASPAFKFEISNNIKELVSRFLCRFDAIFSLNQDLLLERHYFQQVSIMARDVGRSWNGCASPGLTPIPNASYSPAVSQWKPTDWDGQPSPNIQPYIKLHGSSNWLAPNNGRLLITGENKSTQISNQNPLQKYQDYFRGCLCGSNVRLMVIGFSF